MSKERIIELQSKLKEVQRAPYLNDGQQDLFSLVEGRCVEPLISEFRRYKRGEIPLKDIPIFGFFNVGLPTAGKTYWFDLEKEYIRLRLLDEEVDIEVDEIKWEKDGEAEARSNGLIRTPFGYPLTNDEIIDTNLQLIESLYRKMQNPRMKIILGEFPVTALRVEENMYAENVLGRPLGYHMLEAACRRLPPFNMLQTPIMMRIAALTPNHWLQAIAPHRREAIKNPNTDFLQAKQELKDLGVSPLPQTKEALSKQGIDGATLDEIIVVQRAFNQATEHLPFRLAQMGLNILIAMVEHNESQLEDINPQQLNEIEEQVREIEEEKSDLDKSGPFPFSEGLVIDMIREGLKHIENNPHAFRRQVYAWRYILRRNFQLSPMDYAILRNNPTLLQMKIIDPDRLINTLDVVRARRLKRITASLVT